MPAATLTRAFDAAATAVAEQIRPLKGAAIHVNGASGFLASNLLALLDRADELHGLGLRLHASARRPAGRVGPVRLSRPRAAVRWDLAPAESTTFPDELAGGVAVHTASYGAPADYMREPMATFQANTAGLIRTFAEAARVGAAHVVYLSSAEVYGQPPAEAIPTREDYRGGPDLGDPRSIYGESKRMAEVLGASLSRQTGIAFTAVRPWNLYGPGQRLDDGRVPLALMRMALGRGDNPPKRRNSAPEPVLCLGRAGAARRVPRSRGRAERAGQHRQSRRRAQHRRAGAPLRRGRRPLAGARADRAAGQRPGPAAVRARYRPRAGSAPVSRYPRSPRCPTDCHCCGTGWPGAGPMLELPVADRCRLSGEPLADAPVLLELADCPLPGIYPDEIRESLALRSPLRVVRAPGSGLVQLAHRFDPSLYADYGFAADTSDAYRAHLEWFAGELHAGAAPGRGGPRGRLRRRHAARAAARPRTPRRTRDRPGSGRGGAGRRRAA